MVSSRFSLAAAAVALLVAALVPLAVDGVVVLPTVIGSNMVLQRTIGAVRLWGWAKPMDTLNVWLTGQAAIHLETTVQPDGTFQIEFPSLVGVDYTIDFADSESTVTIVNVAFGEVILCSGQSNMELTVIGANNATAEIADSINYPLLRMFSVARTASLTPQDNCVSKVTAFNWTVSGPDAFIDHNEEAWTTFSATCYFTGRALYKHFGGEVPIGLVASDWGGTIVEAWSSPDALAKCPSTRRLRRRLVSDANNAIADDSRFATSHPVSADSPKPNTPSVLYNGQIYPLLNMRFAMALWYQGESNVGNPDSYKCRFPAMIADWRDKFGLALPFFFVQVAAYPEGDPTKWPLLQIAQTAALALPNVGMASAMDLGDPTSPNGSIHPRDKQTVGLRLANAALKIVYGDKELVITGPLPSTATIAKADWVNVLLTFDPESIPSGQLTFKGTEACNYNMTGGCCDQNPFEIGTTLGNYYRVVTSTIGDGQMTVAIDPPADGAQVAFVRYNFQAYAQCAYYNSADLPMTPFIFPVKCTEC